MADTNTYQAQANELSQKLWAIANELRGQMDASEFKNYILGVIFYRYLSERTEMYMAEILENDGVTYEEAFADDDYKPVVEDWSLSKLGYVIKPENLFRNLIRKITKFENDADKFSVEDFEKAINDLVGSTMGHESNKAFDGLFNDMRLQDARLGETVAGRTDMIGRVMVKVSDIDFDLQDSQFDVLGTAYMILIGLFASDAGKKGGEFFTPAGPSRLCATLASLGLDEAKTVGDCTCGSASMLLEVQKHLTTHKVGHFYGQELNATTYNLSRMNMIMHGDGHGGVHHHDGLLNVNGIFEERFDVILTNPPFGQNVDRNQLISVADRFTDEEMKQKYKAKYGKSYDKALKQVDDHIGESLLSLYDLGSTSTLTEVLFMERCLRLLKKGGRMGMVLPEGVLNNKNLASVREYFEGRAKLILICSIPQDVFIAAGATVKPSLVFMRKFTAEEEFEYSRCKKEAILEITALHQAEIDSFTETIAACDAQTDSLKDDLKDAKIRLRKAKKDKKDTAAIEAEIDVIQQEQKKNKGKKKTAEKALADLKKLIHEESKPVTKKKFDYDIPIAKVEDAGITTTGAASEGNQLPARVKEYREYCNNAKLWSINTLNNVYSINDGTVYRILDGQEVQINA